MSEAASGPAPGAPAHGRLAERIDALLPQTQCRRCGFDGCRPYAESLAHGDSALNRCPPGGTPVIEALAALLGLPAEPLDPTCGEATAPTVARVVEPDCIGCARCIDVCPTDAVAGARKWMHAVLEEDCSGCELCLPACPVDCIVMVPARGLAPEPPGATTIATRARHFRYLFERQRTRQARDQRRWRDALQARLSDDPGAR